MSFETDSYSQETSIGTLRASLSIYDASWRPTEQIPVRAIGTILDVSTGTEVSADVGAQNSLCWRLGTVGDQPYSGSDFPFVGGRPRRFGGGGLKVEPLRTFSGTSAACSRIR